MLHWAVQNLELSSQHTALLATAHHWMGNRLHELIQENNPSSLVENQNEGEEKKEADNQDEKMDE